MTATVSTHYKQANPIRIAPLFRWLLLALFVAGCGLLYVYIKNQQHFLGEETRKVELKTHELHTLNEVLQVRINRLSSTAEIQRKLDTGLIVLKHIPKESLARLTPPVVAEKDGILRTADNGGYRP